MESLEIENLCWKDKTQKVPGLHDNSNDRQKRMLIYQNTYNAYKLQKHILYNNIVQHIPTEYIMNNLNFYTQPSVLPIWIIPTAPISSKNRASTRYIIRYCVYYIFYYINCTYIICTYVLLLLLYLYCLALSIVSILSNQSVLFAF